MSEEKDPDSRLAMVLLRHLRGWDQARLAKFTGIAASQVSVYDRGERAIPREALEKVAAAAELPAHLLDPLLHEIRAFRAAAAGRSRADRVLAGAAAAELMAVLQGAIDAVLAPERRSERSARTRPRAPRPEDRAEAARLWEVLAARAPDERRLLVEAAEEYRTWAVCERAAAASLEAARGEPGQALELAELALAIAGEITGSESWRRRLQGYCWAHVGNAHRAAGDLPAAQAALAQAGKLWREGAAGDPGLLSTAVLPQIESALRCEGCPTEHPAAARRRRSAPRRRL